jgi:thioredoxin:protein disulfide reductase
LKVSTARGEINDDPTLGPTEIYHREAEAYVDGDDLPESEEILVTYQGCRENAVCYSPITKSIDLATYSRMQAEGSGSSDLSDAMIEAFAAKLLRVADR